MRKLTIKQLEKLNIQLEKLYDSEDLPMINGMQIIETQNVIKAIIKLRGN